MAQQSTSRPWDAKVCIMGAGGVGKSALTIRLINGNWLKEYDPTIEDCYRKKVVIKYKGEDRTTLIDILDTAGQEEFNAMQDQWMRECPAFLCVYGIDNKESFEEAENLIKKIYRTKNCEEDNGYLDPQGRFVPIVVAGNKCDLKNNREVNQKDLDELLARYPNVKGIETSAKAEINNLECFYILIKQMWAADDMVNNKEADDPGCGCTIM